jgi:hypothetical protein
VADVSCSPFKNIENKNSVFSVLFSDPAALRELYGALEGVTLPPDVPVSINNPARRTFYGADLRHFLRHRG